MWKFPKTGIMKILQGSLVETLYDWPEKDGTMAQQDAATMTPRKKTVLNENDVAYMSDKVCKTTRDYCISH